MPYKNNNYLLTIETSGIYALAQNIRKVTMIKKKQNVLN